MPQLDIHHRPGDRYPPGRGGGRSRRRAPGRPLRHEPGDRLRPAAHDSRPPSRDTGRNRGRTVPAHRGLLPQLAHRRPRAAERGALPVVPAGLCPLLGAPPPRPAGRATRAGGSPRRRAARPAHPRDGISILGGEPFAQPDGLLALVQALRDQGCPHILVYSGYTYEHLRRRARRQSAIGAALDAIDMLVDGPYVEALADGAGPWTGSGNQRVLALTGGHPAPWPGT